MTIPRTGSLGPVRDTWALAQAGCYDPTCSGWDAPAEILELLHWHEKQNWDDPQTHFPFKPTCTECRKAGKRVMEQRGLDREQIKRLFEKVGAKWQWTSRETDEKRRQSDKGVSIIDLDGKPSLDTTVKARQRRAVAKIGRQDRREDRAEQNKKKKKTA